MPQENGAEAKDSSNLTQEQKDYIATAIQAGLGAPEIAVVLSLAEVAGKTPMEMQSRWMDFRTGVISEKRRLALGKGIIL